MISSLAVTGSEVRVLWLGQAGFLLAAKGGSLAIDPYCTNACAAEGFVRKYPPLIGPGTFAVDAAISTHDHGDHLDVGTLRDSVSFRRFYGPGSCISHMTEAGFPPERLCLFNRGQTVQEGPFRLTALFADHTEDSIGVFVECGGYRIYFTGDSLFHPAMYDVRRLAPELMFVCINGKFGNMIWQEAASLAAHAGVKAAIPMHYDLFSINSEDPGPFIAAVQEFGVRSRELERGVAYDVAELL